MLQDHFRYFILNKPYGMESQFVSPYPGDLLGDLPFDFPESTHAIGRLDKCSEGLLLLTTNKKITALLFQSRVPHKRTYLVQVKNKMSAGNLSALRTGVTIRIKGGSHYTTPPCDVQIAEPPRNLFPSPYFIHPSVESTWLLITLTEGRYHQVRKMVAAVHHRCLRLIRVSIENMELHSLPPGEVRETDEALFFRQLNLDTTSITSPAEMII